MGMAATENIYHTKQSFPYFGPPGTGLFKLTLPRLIADFSRYLCSLLTLKQCYEGVGLNAGVIMMNLTR